MINKNIKKLFGRDITTSMIIDSMEQAKRDLVWETVKEIALNTDYIFRLDTYTSTDPFLDVIVFDAQCRAEKVDEFPIFNRSIIAPKQTYLPEPKTVIFHPPATIVYWEDGEKTIVKCMEGDEFNPEVVLAMCLAKYIFGKRYKKWFRDALKKGGWEE